MPSDIKNSNIKRLKEMLNTYQLSLLINKPTRTTELTKTLLDLIICKTDDLKTVITDVVDVAISDHNLVYIYVERLEYLDESLELLKKGNTTN